jgi:regulator of replication initiation timing
MADDISKKVLVEIDIAGDDATAAVADLKNKVDNLKASIVSNKQAISDAKKAQADYTAEIAKGKLEQQNIKTAIDKARLATIKATAATKQSKAAIQAAAGSYDEAQKKLTAMGLAIKSAEGGFRSSDPAIKAQIQQYRQLNDQLQKFDKQLGNHQRNVGNYQSVISGLNSSIGRLIPGFSQFSSILQIAAKGFDTFKGSTQGASTGITETGEAAAGSEVAMTGLSASLIGIVAAAAAAALVLGALLKSFANLTPQAELVSRQMAGFKNVWQHAVSEVFSPNRTMMELKCN